MGFNSAFKGLNRTRFTTSTVSGLRGLKSSLKQCAVRMCSAKRLHRTGTKDVLAGRDEQDSSRGYITEDGSREALTAGGARFQARKQIAASRDGLEAGLISSAQTAFF